MAYMVPVHYNHVETPTSFIHFIFLVLFVEFRMILLPVLLMVITSCLLSSGIPRLTNNAMLWKRLGLNRGIGNERPQITSSKKKGESTVYFIKLPPQPHYYSAFNLLPTSNDQKNTPEPFETVNVFNYYYQDLFFFVEGTEDGRCTISQTCNKKY